MKRATNPLRAALAAGGTGSLVVANGGSFSAGGAMTIWSGGSVTLNGGDISASSMNVNGGILAGSGDVTLALNGDLIAASGAKLSPGNSAGTLAILLSGSGVMNIAGAVTPAASDTFTFEIGALGASDLITLTGGPLSIGSGVLEFDDFDFPTLAGFSAGTHTLIDGNMPLGTLGANVTGIIAGLNATISLADGGNDLVLNITPVPEPGTAAVGIALLGVAMGRRRRRQA